MTISYVDNADAGYSEVGGGWTLDPSSGRGGTLKYAGPSGTGTNKARWTLTGLTAGDLVSLAWTWPPVANRATNVPWRVYDSDGTTLLASGTQNQELAPTHFTEDSSLWQETVRRVVTGTSISFEINDNANEYVIADAVRFDHAAVPANTTATLDSGDWSDASNWSNGLPGAGDTAIVCEQHTITVDIDSTVDNLEIYGPVVVANNVKLTVTGGVLQGNANFTLGEGSELEFDTTAGDVKWLQGRYSLETDCYVKSVGIEANPASISVIGGNYAWFDVSGEGDNSINGCTGWDLLWCEVDGLLDSTETFGIGVNNQGHQSMRLRNCSFTNCGTIWKTRGQTWNSNLNQDWQVEHTAFATPASNPCISAIISSASGSGTRTFDHNAIGDSIQLNLENVAVDDNYFDDCPSSFGTVPASFDRNTVRWNSNIQTFSIPLSLTPTYLLADHVEVGNIGNPHIVVLTNDTDGNVTGCVFEYPHALTIDMGDAIFGSPGTATFQNNIVIPSITDGITGSCLTNPSGPTGWAVKLYHNTVVGDGAQLYFKEAHTAPGVQPIKEIKSNLVISYNSSGDNRARIVWDLHASTDNSLDIADPAEISNNGTLNPKPFTDPLTLEDYDGFEACFSTPPEAPIISDPDFVDVTRNAARWAVYKGAVGAEPALPHDNATWLTWKRDALDAVRDLLFADPTLGYSDLMPWVKAGFAPQNPVYEDAGHDSVTIGAMGFSSAPILAEVPQGLITVNAGSVNTHKSASVSEVSSTVTASALGGIISNNLLPSPLTITSPAVLSSHQAGLIPSQITISGINVLTGSTATLVSSQVIVTGIPPESAGITPVTPAVTTLSATTLTTVKVSDVPFLQVNLTAGTLGANLGDELVSGVIVVTAPTINTTKQATAPSDLITVSSVTPEVLTGSTLVPATVTVVGVTPDSSKLASLLSAIITIGTAEFDEAEVLPRQRLIINVPATRLVVELESGTP